MAVKEWQWSPAAVWSAMQRRQRGFPSLAALHRTDAMDSSSSSKTAEGLCLYSPLSLSTCLSRIEENSPTDLHLDGPKGLTRYLRVGGRLF